MPFVGRETGHTVNGQRNENVGGQHVQPDIDGQRREKGKETRWSCCRHLEENADAEIHERFGEIDDRLSGVVDCHRTDGQISFLQYTIRAYGA